MFFLFVSYYSLFFRNFPEVFANIQLSRNFSKISEFIITGFCPPIFPFFVMSLLFWSIFNNFTISLIYNACPEYANITLVYTHIYYIYNIHILYVLHSIFQTVVECRCFFTVWGFGLRAHGPVPWGAQGAPWAWTKPLRHHGCGEKCGQGL